MTTINSLTAVSTVGYTPTDVRDLVDTDFGPWDAVTRLTDLLGIPASPLVRDLVADLWTDLAIVADIARGDWRHVLEVHDPDGGDITHAGAQNFAQEADADADCVAARLIALAELQAA